MTFDLRMMGWLSPALTVAAMGLVLGGCGDDSSLFSDDGAQVGAGGDGA